MKINQKKELNAETVLSDKFILISVFSFSFKNRPLKPQHDQGESTNPDWRVFVLQNMDATQLYKAVVCCALFSADNTSLTHDKSSSELCR